MPRQKVTLTLPTETLDELRELVGARSLSATVERALIEHLGRLRHMAAIDEWLVEMEREHGPVQPQTLEWAARVVREWDAARQRTRRAD